MALVGLLLSIQTMLTGNSWRSTSLYLWNNEIKAVYLHTWHKVLFMRHENIKLL